MNRFGLLRRRRGGGSAPAPTIESLFAADEVGFWYDPSDSATVWQDAAGTTPAGDGDSVQRIDDKSGNGFNAIFDTTAPVLRQDGDLWYLEFGAGAKLVADAALDLDGSTWDFAVAYNPTGGNFVLVSREGGGAPYAGIGQSGSSSTGMAGAGANSGPTTFYYDNTLETPSTRGENYTLGQAHSRALINFPVNAAWASVKVGDYGAGFGAIGDLYAIVLREGAMDETQRATLDSYLSAVSP